MIENEYKSSADVSNTRKVGPQGEDNTRYIRTFYLAVYNVEQCSTTSASGRMEENAVPLFATLVFSPLSLSRQCQSEKRSCSFIRSDGMELATNHVTGGGRVYEWGAGGARVREDRGDSPFRRRRARTTLPKQ